VAVGTRALPSPRRTRRGLGRHVYTLMILPAVVTILLIIAYPLVYTLWMAVHEYSMGAAGPPPFIGLANYRQLMVNQRFLEAIPRTFLFTLIGVAGPVVLGTAAALAFAREFPGRGLLRTIFSLPMMATPVSVALIWQMMFHPQLGILNYLLSLVGIGPQPWIFSRQVIRYVTLPLVWPYIMVAIILRAIDALKTFDIIYVMTQGGPGTATETLNIFLYLQAFAFFNIGFASAVVVVYFLILMVMSVGLMITRQKTSWQ
jgi:multiple sugar transport system permease protein